MAQAIVSHTVNKLEDLMCGDPESLHGMNDDIHWMKRELKKLLSFLKDGDAKQNRDKKIKSWIKDVREVAHGVEDLVDNYLYRASRFPHSFSSINSRRSFFKKVDETKKRINGLSAQRLTLGLVNLGAHCYVPDRNVDPKGRSRECVFVDGDDDVRSIVGFGEERKAIIGQLKSSGNQLLVLSLVGTDGIGKTTLARSVYQNPEIKRMFVARAWVSVTKHCTVTDILRNTIKELATIPKKIKGHTLSDRSKSIIDEIKQDQSSLESWKEEDIKLAVHELIKIKGKCLIVMDDVSRKELWGRIQTAFAMTNNGSRVLLTTRNMEVGKFVGTNRHELCLLNENESKLLFLKRLYPDDIVHEFMDDLKEVGEKLLRICAGLPMHLVLLGSLLSRREKNFGVWSKVLETLTLHSNDIPGLCYDELPLELKHCFLYIGAFEEGSEVNASQLKRLWMAESLVLDKEGNQEREQIANQYLEELRKRSLVQVTKRKYNGSPSRIQIHRLLRELCSKVTKENNFFNVEERCSKSSSSPPSENTVRRLAFPCGIPNTFFDPMSSGLTTPILRTFMCFGSSKLQHRLGQHLEGLKLLTVIDVEGEKRLTTIPNEISSLIHLRYLRWIVHSNHGVKVLPSLENLHNLQTLATNATITIEDGLDGLKSIRCLTHVKCGLLVAKQLIKLTNLRRLKVTFNEAVILNQFEKHRTLESLSLFGEEGSIPMEAFTVFPSLHKLKIYGILTDSKPLPAYTSFPQGLTKLTLAFSCLTTDPMPILEKLPNLMILSLEDRVYDGKSLVCSMSGFPRLLRLVLKKLEKLEEWEVAYGAMKKLRSLAIEGCRRLKMLPEGLQHINSLKEIKLIQMGNMVVIE